MRSTWSRKASRWPRPPSSGQDDQGEQPMKLSRRTTQSLRRAGLRLPAELLLGGGDRAASHRGRADPQGRPPGGLAREDRRAAHRLRRAHLQRGVPPAGAAIRGWSSRCKQYFGEDVYVHQFKLNAKAAFEGDVWQWHQDYGTWARDDGMPQAARHEHRGVPRRGDADQRPAAAHSRQPQAGRVRGRPRQADHVLSAVDARQGHRDAALPRGRGRARQPASSRRPASPARC